MLGKIRYTIATLVGLFAVWYGLSLRPEAQFGWTEPYVYDLAKEVMPSECTSRGCNLTPALQRSIAACESELAGTTGNRSLTGCTFLIPAGDHSVTETISTCRAHQFIGRGGNTRRAATTITVPDITFIHGRGFGDCGGSAAGRVVVRGMGIIYPSGPKATPVVAIHAEASVRLDDLWIIYPSIGVLIDAGVDRTPQSNANTSILTAVKTEYTRHAGVKFNGYDSNAHAVIAPNFGTACYAKTNSDPSEMATLEAQFGPCGAYVDDSFLGSFAVAGHFSAASGYPDVRIVGASNHGACLGCYQEGPDPGLLDQHAQWIGGKSVEPTGTGFWLAGSRASRLTLINSMDPANVVTLRLGAATNTAGAFYGLHHNDTNWPLRMKWNRTLNGGSFIEDIANASTGRVRSIRGTRNGVIPPGGDSDALGRTKHWDVEEILGQ